jgi:branched-chain amino acid transport system ATP-binding protein
MALLEVDNVTVTFVGLRALSGVSFKVNPGQICAIIGPNGAGKSTLFNVITGYTTPSEGTVRFDGRSVLGRSPHVIASAGVRRTFQNGGVFGEMTVLENVLTGLNQLTPSSSLELIFNLRRSLKAERAAVRKARSLLELMGLAEHADKMAADLSSGQQRMVEITRAIAAHARLLLLDEPAVGLSTSERDHLMTVLRDLASEGIAILFIEHLIDLVMAVSDRIVVLNYGEVIAEDTPEKIRSHEAVLEAYLGHT